MEVSVICDNVTTINRKHSHGLGLANSLTRQHNFTLYSPDQQRRLQIHAQILPIDAVAPPPVKPSTIPKTHIRKRSRVRRRKVDGVGADEGGGFFGGGDGPFGGGGGNNGNGGDFNGFNWDESSSSPSDPAFDFVYEVLSWFVLSNCLYFAFKRLVRIVVDGSADPGE
ncbi:hypothetical protein L1987_26154 [Smallanthus sonchifolius]|uniref:Uncharacterized protein n=1 Tax=Smallanthus sonchifolius TaxID=185202 RepID=A0ACB9IBU3_9ASTR|nr:hypothetical protein L1987_26154 [Smallanthus sonchifolius]